MRRQVIEQSAGPRQSVTRADGPLQGSEPGRLPALRLAIVGESTAAGYGAPTHETSIAGHLAKALRERTGREVSWRVHARGGATARRVSTALVPRLSDDGWTPTHVVVLIGINDLRLTWRPGTWNRSVAELLTTIGRRCPDARVVVSGLPDLRAIPALPRSLVPVLVMKAKRMAACTQAAAAAAGAHYVAVEHLPLPAEFFSPDGLHPGPDGYARWASVLAPALAPALT